MNRTLSVTVQMDNMLLITVRETARRISCGETSVRELIARGELPVVRVGRSVRIPVAALQAWVEKQLSIALSSELEDVELCLTAIRGGPSTNIRQFRGAQITDQEA
jgi:excisionase family DNA binding protein